MVKKKREEMKKEKEKRNEKKRRRRNNWVEWVLSLCRLEDADRSCGALPQNQVLCFDVPP